MGALTLASAERGTLAQSESLETNQFLTFVLGHDAFAVAISGVREIIEYREPTTVPLMPDFVRGVMNLRGRVVPVVDLLIRFGRAPSALSRRTCIVVFEVGGEGEQLYLGAVVDAVTAVVDIAPSDIEPPPSFGAKLRNDFIVGMAKAGEKLLVVLDTSRVLSIDELAALAGANISGALAEAGAGRGAQQD